MLLNVLLTTVLLTLSHPSIASAAEPDVTPSPKTGAIAEFDGERGNAWGWVGPLKLCRGRVSNAPKVDRERRVTGFRQHIVVRGVELFTVPTVRVCMSSGIGMRRGKFHQGVDFASDEMPGVFAAADGVVIEQRVRRGYGNTVLIDHGKGVYTRYAHLDRYVIGVRDGHVVKMGQNIGRMGNTGVSSGVHLHFELLTGTFDPTKGWQALTPLDPLTGRIVRRLKRDSK